MRTPPLILLILGAALAAVAVWLPADGPDVLVVDIDAAGPEPTISWAGDTMFGDAAEEAIRRHGLAWTMDEMGNVLPSDVRIVNAEAPFTRRDAPEVEKRFIYRSRPEAANALAERGFTVVGLANNHSMDHGEAGLADSIDAITDAGLVPFGAGLGAEQAERPLLIRTAQITIGVVALTEYYGEVFTASDHTAGTVPMSNRSINSGISAARRAGADVVVGWVHWGDNYETMPNQLQITNARRFAAAGYDIVIGHGPHVVQPAYEVDGMPVFFSIGNFVFGTPGRYTEEAAGRGLVIRTRFDHNGLSGVDAACIVTDNQIVEFQPRPCDDDGVAAVASMIEVGSVG